MARARSTPALPTAKVFRTGGSQAVRPPKEYRFDTAEVTVRRVGSSVVLTPVAPGYDDSFRRMVSGEPEELFERPPQGKSERRARIR